MLTAAGVIKWLTAPAGEAQAWLIPTACWAAVVLLAAFAGLLAVLASVLERSGFIHIADIVGPGAAAAERISDHRGPRHDSGGLAFGRNQCAEHLARTRADSRSSRSPKQL